MDILLISKMGLIIRFSGTILSYFKIWWRYSFSDVTALSIIPSLNRLDMPIRSEGISYGQPINQRSFQCVRCPVVCIYVFVSLNSKCHIRIYLLHSRVASTESGCMMYYILK
jgi:hypothetical protein